MSLTCSHCGLPLSGKKISLDSDKHALYFCCHGCRIAYQILNSPEASTHEKILEDTIDRMTIKKSGHLSSDIEELEFSVEGMVCNVCVPIINTILQKTDGVCDSRVNFITGRVWISFKPAVISPEKIKKRLGRFGYNAIEAGRAADDRGNASVLIRVSLGLFLAIDIMMLSIPEYFSAFAPSEVHLILYLRLVMAALCLPILLWVAGPIFMRAYVSLVTMRPDMHFLVATGTSAAFAYSIYATARGGPHVYFETAAFLPVIITIGKSLEDRAKLKARETLLQMVDILPSKAFVIRDTDTVPVPPETLAPGDVVRVLENERVPCDGTVIDGSVLLDEMMLTGESTPRWREPGETVRAGAEVLAGKARLRVGVCLEESLLSMVVGSLERSELFQGKRQLMLDRVVSVMAPGVLVLGVMAGALAFFGQAGVEQSLMRGIAVILFACPCALGLATPLARAVAIGRAAAIGIVIRDGEALEVGVNPTRLVIDKTGTLTLGMLVLHEVCRAPELDVGDDEVVALAAALDKGSSHPVAAALLRSALEMDIDVPDTSDVIEETGRGRKGIILGKNYLFGSLRLLVSYRVDPPEWAKTVGHELSGQGLSISYLAMEREHGWAVLGVLGFVDQLREESPSVIAALRDMGIEPVLATGDLASAARPVAEACGISEVYTEQSPQDKRDLVIRLKEEGHVVWAVGDGVNDAPALSVAQLGIAMGRGARLTSEAAHLTLAGGRLKRLPDLIEITKSLRRTVRANLVWAVCYNAIGLPLAFIGILRPVFSAIAMTISSLSVAMNSLGASGPKTKKRED